MPTATRDQMTEILDHHADRFSRVFKRAEAKYQEHMQSDAAFREGSIQGHRIYMSSCLQYFARDEFAGVPGVMIRVEFETVYLNFGDDLHIRFAHLHEKTGLPASNGTARSTSVFQLGQLLIFDAEGECFSSGTVLVATAGYWMDDVKHKIIATDLLTMLNGREHVRLPISLPDDAPGVLPSISPSPIVPPSRTGTKVVGKPQPATEQHPA